ncbi:hypothetical protein ScPMuIL_017607 [Solemya velum]
MADWDDEDYEPKFSQPSDKWEGEDEEDVKDSWEEDNEKKAENPAEPSTDVKAFQKKKKKKLNDKLIAEKEAARAREEAEQFTSEDKVAEKLKQQKLQENADLELAKQAFGLEEQQQQQLSGIDAMTPETEEEFVEFKDALVKKLTQFSKSTNYTGFLERLFTELIIPLQTEETRKIYSSVNNLLHEKQKLQKEQDKKKKKKGKAVIRAERDDDYGDLVAATEYYDEEELI